MIKRVQGAEADNEGRLASSAACSSLAPFHQAPDSGWRPCFWSWDWPSPGLSASRQPSISASAQDGDKRRRPAGAGHAGAGRRPGEREQQRSQTRPDRQCPSGRKWPDGPAQIPARAPIAHPRITVPKPAPGQIPSWISATRCSWAAGEAVRARRQATLRPADQRLTAAEGGANKTGRPRRRVGFRKGADVDGELWPAESFGGVSDEQFWNDLASDKPLTTTARTAQQDPGIRNRPLDAVPPSAARPAPARPSRWPRRLRLYRPWPPSPSRA